MEDRRRVAGAAFGDVSWMRAELGIDANES